MPCFLLRRRHYQVMLWAYSMLVCGIHRHHTTRNFRMQRSGQLMPHPQVRAIPGPKNEGASWQKISGLEQEGAKSCRGRCRLLLATTGERDIWLCRKGCGMVVIGGRQKGETTSAPAH